MDTLFEKMLQSGFVGFVEMDCCSVTELTSQYNVVLRQCHKGATLNDQLLPFEPLLKLHSGHGTLQTGQMSNYIQRQKNLHRCARQKSASGTSTKIKTLLVFECFNHWFLKL